MATILVVDDRAVNRQFVLALLERSGHRLLEATNGVDALQIVRDEHPDLIITDIMMQPMDGFQLAMRLRADPVLPLPHIIFLSATYFEMEARALAQACGAARFISKPVEPQMLLHAINQILANAPAAQDQRMRPDEKLIDGYVRLMAEKLNRRVGELEALNTDPDQRATERNAQLESTNAGLQKEIVHREQVEEKLRDTNLRLSEQVMRDPLTGLFNRRYLEESLQREVARSRRSGNPLGVMMIDIDHFKRINDTYGHAAGDTVLQHVSRCMQSMARAEDILCRYGGDEFVLVMTTVSQNTFHARAEMVREGVRQLTIEHEGCQVGQVTVSIGFAIHPEHGDSGSDSLHAADVALYRAKQAGRDRTVSASAAGN